MKTKFNQKQLRAKSDVKFGTTFEDLFQPIQHKENSDRISLMNNIQKNTIVNVVESICIDQKWYHRAFVPTTKQIVWIQGSQFVNVPDNVIFAHLKIDSTSWYIEDKKMDKMIQPGYVTVATTRKPLSNDANIFEYGFSFCSPEDIFSKKFGRNKAKDMLNKHTHVFLAETEDANLSTYERCFRAMLKYVSYCSFNNLVIPWFPLKNINDIEKFRQCDLIA